jgi:hypothetical protein
VAKSKAAHNISQSVIILMSWVLNVLAKLGIIELEMLCLLKLGLRST